MKKPNQLFFFLVLLLPLLAFSQTFFCEGPTFITSNQAIFDEKQETTFFIKTEPSAALIIAENLPSWLTINEDIITSTGGLIPSGTWSITGTPPKNSKKRYEITLVALTTPDSNVSLAMLAECYLCQKQGGCPTICPKICESKQKFTLYVKNKTHKKHTKNHHKKHSSSHSSSR